MRGTAELQQLLVRGALIDSARFGFAASQHGLRVADFRAALYRGQIAGRATVPFDSRVPGSADVDWKGIDAGTLVNDLQWTEQPLRANLAGHFHLQLPVGHELDPLKLQGEGLVKATNVNGLGIQRGEITAQVSMHDSTMDASKLLAEWPEGRVQGRMSLLLKDGYDFSAELTAKGSLASLTLRGSYQRIRQNPRVG